MKMPLQSWFPLMVGQDGAVLDTGVPILCDSFSPDSPENVQLFLEGFGAQVSEITIQTKIHIVWNFIGL